MSKKILKMISIAIVILLSFGILAGCSQNQSSNNTGEKQKSQFMTFGAPPSSSSLYPYWVSVGKAIGSVNPEFKITVSDSQGAIDITKRVRNGSFNVGNSMSSADYENYNGLGVFEGDAFKDVRILWYFDATPIQMIVTEESGIKDVSELNGKKFNPGGTGTSAAVITKQICDVLGVQPDYFEAGQGDAGDAVANKQIIGTSKAGPAPDSFVMQIEAKTDINMISFTDEEIKKVCEKYPYLSPVVIPANTYNSVDYDVKTFQVMMGAQTTTNLSQEDGYKMIKAIMEDARETWENAYPKGKDNDIVNLTLDAKVPLHAGTVQYLKEKGYDVPKELIPEEYKE